MSVDVLVANLSASAANGLPQTSPAAKVAPQDIARFEAAYKEAGSLQIQPPSTAALDAQPKRQPSLLDPLLSLNTHAADLGQQANLATGKELRPSELMMLTMRSHEFLFHCELVSNVANRSSDGVQQLFRQQS